MTIKGIKRVVRIATVILVSFMLTGCLFQEEGGVTSFSTGTITDFLLGTEEGKFSPDTTIGSPLAPPNDNSATIRVYRQYMKDHPEMSAKAKAMLEEVFVKYAVSYESTIKANILAVLNWEAKRAEIHKMIADTLRGYVIEELFNKRAEMTYDGDKYDRWTALLDNGEEVYEALTALKEFLEVTDFLSYDEEIEFVSSDEFKELYTAVFDYYEIDGYYELTDDKGNVKHINYDDLVSYDDLLAIIKENEELPDEDFPDNSLPDEDSPDNSLPDEDTEIIVDYESIIVHTNINLLHEFFPVAAEKIPEHLHSLRSHIEDNYALRMSETAELLSFFYFLNDNGVCPNHVNDYHYTEGLLSFANADYLEDAFRMKLKSYGEEEDFNRYEDENIFNFLMYSKLNSEILTENTVISQYSSQYEDDPIIFYDMFFNWLGMRGEKGEDMYFISSPDLPEEEIITTFTRMMTCMLPLPDFFAPGYTSRYVTINHSGKYWPEDRFIWLNPAVTSWEQVQDFYRANSYKNIRMPEGEMPTGFELPKEAKGLFDTDDFNTKTSLENFYSENLSGEWADWFQWILNGAEIGGVSFKEKYENTVTYYSKVVIYGQPVVVEFSDFIDNQWKAISRKEPTVPSPREMCHEHLISYHTIEPELIAYIEEKGRSFDEFYTSETYTTEGLWFSEEEEDWYSSTKLLIGNVSENFPEKPFNSCPEDYNIRRFVEFYEIPKEDFEAIYSESDRTFKPYNIDAVYGSSEEAMNYFDINYVPGRPVEYDLNGVGGKAPQTLYVPANRAFTIANPPQVLGKGFEEWNTSPDGTGDKYMPYEEVTMTEEGFPKLYAIWGDVRYTVTFDWNVNEDIVPTLVTIDTSGGTMHHDIKLNPIPPLAGMFYGDVIDLPSPEPHSYPFGFEFVGWQTESPWLYGTEENLEMIASVEDYIGMEPSPDGIYLQYSIDRFDSSHKFQIIMPPEDVVFKAVWKLRRHTIIYDLNGGHIKGGSGLKTEFITLKSAHSIADTNAVSEYDTAFVEWNTEKDGSGTSYTAGYVINIFDLIMYDYNIDNLFDISEEGLYLYAIYEPKPKGYDEFYHYDVGY